LYVVLVGLKKSSAFPSILIPDKLASVGGGKSSKTTEYLSVFSPFVTTTVVVRCANVPASAVAGVMVVVASGYFAVAVTVGIVVLSHSVRQTYENVFSLKLPIDSSSTLRSASFASSTFFSSTMSSGAKPLLFSLE